MGTPNVWARKEFTTEDYLNDVTTSLNKYEDVLKQLEDYPEWTAKVFIYFLIIIKKISKILQNLNILFYTKKTFFFSKILNLLIGQGSGRISIAHDLYVPCLGS